MAASDLTASGPGAAKDGMEVEQTEVPPEEHASDDVTPGDDRAEDESSSGGDRQLSPEWCSGSEGIKMEAVATGSRRRNRWMRLPLSSARAAMRRAHASVRGWTEMCKRAISGAHQNYTRVFKEARQPRSVRAQQHIVACAVRTQRRMCQAGTTATETCGSMRLGSGTPVASQLGLTQG